MQYHDRQYNTQEGLRVGLNYFEVTHIFAYLELGVVGVLLDLDALGVLPARLQQEVLDLLDLTRHLRFCKHFHVFNSM